MLKLRDCAAALHPPPALLAGSSRVQAVPRAQAHQATSPASVYAIQAAERIDLGGREPALYCISGAVGSCIQLFEKARDPQTMTLLGGDDFARRSRKIHPFAILLSLQNQVAATLSLRFNWKGPCMNSLDEPTSFVDLMPSMELRQAAGPVLVVMSSAADRRDDREWHELHDPGRPVTEGAVAMLFDSDGGLGEVHVAPADREATPAASALFSENPVATGLEVGLACLVSLAQGSTGDVYELHCGDRRACFEWRAP